MYNKIANEQIELTFGSTFFKTGKPAPRPKKRKRRPLLIPQWEQKS